MCQEWVSKGDEDPRNRQKKLWKTSDHISKCLELVEEKYLPGNLGLRWSICPRWEWLYIDNLWVLQQVGSGDEERKLGVSTKYLPAPNNDDDMWCMWAAGWVGQPCSQHLLKTVWVLEALEGLSCKAPRNSVLKQEVAGGCNEKQRQGLSGQAIQWWEHRREGNCTVAYLQCQWHGRDPDCFLELCRRFEVSVCPFLNNPNTISTEYDLQDYNIDIEW